jgi:hypothetical protein
MGEDSRESGRGVLRPYFRIRLGLRTTKTSVHSHKISVVEIRTGYNLDETRYRCANPLSNFQLSV